MDLITYAADLTLLNSEAKSLDADSDLGKLFIINDDGSVIFNVNKIPVVYQDDKSLCLIRGVSREMLSQLAAIQVLGECINSEYVFDSEDCRAIYEANYNTVGYMIDDGEGGEVFHQPPYKIGAFA